MLNAGREAEEYPSFLAVRKTPVKLLTSVAPFAQNTTAESRTAEQVNGDLDGDTCEQESAAADTTVAAGFQPQALAQSAKATTAAIRTLVLSDRALHEKAQRAFVSAVQAYSKHVASSIFRVSELDWDGLAEGWGLLRMPKMPELKSWRGVYGSGDAATGGNQEEVGEKRNRDAAEESKDDSSKVQGWDWKKRQNLNLSVDLTTLAFKDKDREKKRQLKLATATAPLSKEQLDEIHAAKRQKKSAWSNKNKKDDVAVERRDRKAKKREQEKRGKMTVEERRKEEETTRMIEEVRRRGVVLEEEFGGFAD